MDVTFTPEGEEPEEEVGAEAEIYLADGQCWIADPEYLAHDSGVGGVIAIQFRDGGLWYLDGETRKWLNVEASEQGKPARKLRPVN